MPDVDDDLARRIDDLLPQTQCRQCGFQGCRPYADAMVQGTPHNLCPPGGTALQERLAALLGRPSLPLVIPAGVAPGIRQVAFIREEECIGCAKCIEACPVDAIVGARQFMHTVINHECTGCELCVEPCPVDCIDLIRRPEQAQTLTDGTRFHARERYQARQARLASRAADKPPIRPQKTRLPPLDTLPESSVNQRKAAYQKARAQHRQIASAIDHLRRHGQTPLPEHLAQAQAKEAEVAELQAQLNAALAATKQVLRDHGLDLGQLKLAATRSELALRHAMNNKANQTEVDALRQQRDVDQARLVATMQGSGLADPD